MSLMDEIILKWYIYLEDIHRGKFHDEMYVNFNQIFSS